MPFQKKNTFGFMPKDSIALDRKPLTIKLRAGIREQVMSIPNWQDELKDLIETWLPDKADQRDQV